MHAQGVYKIVFKSAIFRHVHVNRTFSTIINASEDVFIIVFKRFLKDNDIRGCILEKNLRRVRFPQSYDSILKRFTKQPRLRDVLALLDELNFMC